MSADADKGRRAAILSVAFPYAPVGPRAVGGAEVVCTRMEAALAGLGFASVVVAHEDSETHGRLYGTAVPPGLITDAVRAQVEERQQANIDRALVENRVCLVHMHGLDFCRYEIPSGVPVLVTLHLPPAWYPERIWSLPAQYHLVCVSETQRRACPPAVQERIGVVENGVPLPEAKHLVAQGRYALMLARICPEKNLHVGLDAARLAGVPVLLGGSVFPYEAHQRYFDEEIEPRLTSVGKENASRDGTEDRRAAARFLGPVADAEKDRLLQRASCLLLPSVAPETSSLVAMEALAAGVPVIGMAVGAVPAILEEGRTGFVIEPGPDAAERMAAAIRRLPEIDRRCCRASAEARFPLERMVESYRQMYARIGLVEGWDPGESGLREGVHGTDGAPSVEAAALVVGEVRDGAALEALRGDWETLWATDSGATPFQHPAWLLPWWRQFGPDGELRAVTLREPGGRLAGLLPLYLYQPGAGRDRQLLVVGAGTTDYLDGVWAPWAKGAAARGLAYALQATNGWDVASLQQLRRGSLLCEAAEAAGWPLEYGEPCSTLSVAAGPPAKIRLNGNRYRRKAALRGEICCEVMRSEAEALGAFETLVQFHGARWQGRGEEGVLQDPRVLAHHRESIPRLLQAGLLRLFQLTLGGEPIAVLYALADGPQVAERGLYLYLIGFDEEAAPLSPGTLLLQEVWEYARRNGFAKLDLLRGGETYKRLWGAQKEETFALVLRRQR